MGIDVRNVVKFSVELFASAQTSLYLERLISALHLVADFDVFAVVHYPPFGAPEFIYDNFPGLTSPEAMKSYMPAPIYLIRFMLHAEKE